ncbi:hypothetical protein R5W23_000135 [Gemmata sp. JC673]|uniref:Uncharacterized protein n=1 Tax=Gemmata algarum TaxID=2975278 RepID=A0ABU5EUV0_9BACT|nr:hypothetical protein [Gemmata algarum]MDY3557608.1 hypothetical protein [Gemmata algarum]
MLFTDHEKQIYTAPTGDKYDPIALSYSLVAQSGGMWDEWLDLWCGADTPPQDRATVALQIAGVARRVFGFRRFDEEGGRLDAEVLEAVHHFEEYLSKKA